MKKIGLLCLALVLVLGSLGVAYAAWIDEVDITQTVETGSLKVGVFGVVTDPYEFEGKDILHTSVTPGDFYFSKDITADQVPSTALFDPGTHDFYRSATIAIDQFYPSVTVLEDFVIGVAGTVPVKLDVWFTIDDPCYVYENMDVTWTIWLNGEALTSGGGTVADQLLLVQAALEGMQLHGCDVVIIYFDKYLQQDAAQGCTASFTINVDAIQWNKYAEYQQAPP